MTTNFLARNNNFIINLNLSSTMVKFKKNAIVNGATGKFGDQFTFRQVNGKTVMCEPSSKGGKFSNKQEDVRRRFKFASIYGNAVSNDPERSKEYLAGKNPKYKSVYIAAVTDYLNPPFIVDIKTDSYLGGIGDAISIYADDDFRVSKVSIEIHAADGSLIEKETLTSLSKCVEWIYKAKTKNENVKGRRLLYLFTIFLVM